jgi:hypothetical protein
VTKNESIACLDVAQTGILKFSDMGGDYELTVNEGFNNYSTIEQWRDIDVEETADFFHITNSGATTTMYRRAKITAGANNLGTVKATIYAPESTAAGLCTDNDGDIYAARCFQFIADNPGSATIRLYAGADELNGILQNALRPYRYFNGSWVDLGPDPLVNGIEDGFHYGQGETSGFSFFLLGGENEPTAVTLQSFNVTANNNLVVMGLVIALAAILLTAGLLITRRQTAVRER